MTAAVFTLLSIVDGQRSTDSPRMGAAAVYRKTKDSVVAIEVTTREGMTYGSGFFFGDGQTVATCNHVVDGATKIVVIGTGGSRWAPARISFDRARDAALLHLSASTHRTPLAAARQTEIGEPVFVIGNPLGVLTGSLSTGIVSAHRKIDGVPLVQTTAPISEGSSGSPVLDEQGRVLGMVGFTFSEGQNLNMAIGTEVLKWVSLGKRSVPTLTLFAANAARSGAPMRIAGNAHSTTAETTANSHEVFATEIAQYAGRVVDAFTRWQVADLEWSRGEGGVDEMHVMQEFAAFRAAVSSEANDKALASQATSAGKTGYLDTLASTTQSLLRVADDKFRQDAEAARPGHGAEAAKRDAGEYARMIEALDEFMAMADDPTSTNADAFDEGFPTTAKGQIMMLCQRAFVDADLPHSTVIRDAMPGSEFHIGDRVTGARGSGARVWTAIGTWEDLWQFTSEQAPRIGRSGWEVRITREGRTAVLPMTAGK